MDIITLTRENLEYEHICCAISNKADCQVVSKKAWLSARLDDGLVFKKADARGKCFIEYIPAEKAWAPIKADGYIYINCLWVSGQLKGHGNGGMLLNECIRDSREKGKNGLVALSSPKKKPFLSDPDFLKHSGFTVADTAQPYFELLYLPFGDFTQPKFTEKARSPHIGEQGFVLYYTHQCPYTAKYVPLIEAVAAKRAVPFKTVQITSREEAQNAPAPFTTYSLFLNGNFITNEILSDKRFEQLLTDNGYGQTE